MKHITFYFDPISPYAYLAFEQLPLALMGHSYRVSYKPVLFGALLKHFGQLGPAEMPGKRDWTYRQVLWLAHRHGLELALPAAHPFNSLALLRLAVACDPQGLPNRYACEALLRHVWHGGADAADPQRLVSLTQQLAPSRDPAGEAVKADLKTHTDEAIACGVFGVPTLMAAGGVGSYWVISQTGALISAQHLLRERQTEQKYFFRSGLKTLNFHKEK